MSTQDILKSAPNSSRVLNLLELGNQLQTMKLLQPGEVFFHNPILNKGILQKHRLSARDRENLKNGRTVGTKLFIAYDTDREHEGGKYMFLGQNNAAAIFKEHFGMDVQEDEKSMRDIRLLNILEKLPSLDPFLLRESLRHEKFDIPECYFRISASEYQKIRDNVVREFKPLVEEACGGMANLEELTQIIVDKMWEANDLTILYPLIRALDIKEEYASDVFFAWKGFVYYKIVLGRIQDRFSMFISRLKAAKPINIPTGTVKAEIEKLRPHVINGLMEEFTIAQQNVEDYNHVYRQKLIKDRQPLFFTRFLSSAPRRYEELGGAIAALDHAVTLWRHRFGEQNQPMVRAEEFVDILNDFADGLPDIETVAQRQSEKKAAGAS
jgi:hypothetical protein